MERGAAYLIARQGDDGAWRSEVYGNMGDGWSLTPVVLSALLFCPPATPGIGDAYRRGVDRLAGMPADPEALAYPAYSLALASMVMSVPANGRHAARRAGWIAALRALQLADDLGWREADPSYGGWGYWRGVPRRPPGDGPPGHELLSANLSSTLFAVAALVMAGVPAGDPALVRAARFVDRCRAEDGGFFFTPANDLQNKAGPGVAYGTMTADGVRALLLLGAPPGDPRLAAAAAWLARSWDPAVPPGAFPAQNLWQRDGAWFYWAWTSAHALFRLPPPPAPPGSAAAPWPLRLAEEVRGRQSPADGAWRNTFTAMREDDPLVATPLALAALGLSRMALTGERRTSVPMR